MPMLTSATAPATVSPIAQGRMLTFFAVPPIAPPPPRLAAIRAVSFASTTRNCVRPAASAVAPKTRPRMLIVAPFWRVQLSAMIAVTALLPPLDSRLA